MKCLWRLKVVALLSLLSTLSSCLASEQSVQDVVSNRDHLEGKSLAVGGFGWVNSSWAFREILLFSSRESFEKGAGGEAIVLELSKYSLRRLEEFDGCRIVVSGVFDPGLLGRQGAIASGGMRDVKLIESTSDCVRYGDRNGWLPVTGDLASLVLGVGDAWLDSIGARDESRVVSAMISVGDEKLLDDVRAAYNNKGSRLYWFLNEYLPQWMKSAEGRKKSSARVFSDETGDSDNIKICYSRKGSKEYCISMYMDSGQPRILPFEYISTP
jgi:hypothetical protein